MYTVGLRFLMSFSLSFLKIIAVLAFFHAVGIGFVFASELVSCDMSL